jgi:hypothetical protein
LVPVSAWSVSQKSAVPEKYSVLIWKLGSNSIMGLDCRSVPEILNASPEMMENRVGTGPPGG